jgi:hypothetical protein
MSLKQKCYRKSAPNLVEKYYTFIAWIDEAEIE